MPPGLSLVAMGDVLSVRPTGAPVLQVFDLLLSLEGKADLSVLKNDRFLENYYMLKN